MNQEVGGRGQTKAKEAMTNYACLRGSSASQPQMTFVSVNTDH